MSDVLIAPELNVRDRTIKARFLTTREARPLFARLQEPGLNMLEWADDALELTCTPEDRAFLAEVPTAEIGLVNIVGFFCHAATGEKPLNLTLPTSI